MFRTCSKLPHRLRPKLPPAMLYSQALTGGHQAAPSSSSFSSSSNSPRTTETHPDTNKSTSTPTENTRKDHSKPNKTIRTTHHDRPGRQPAHPPKPHHTPNTPNIQNQETQNQEVYVLTLTTTPSLTTPLTALRRRHFPAHRDRGNLPAHLTLFHALPGSEMETDLIPALEELCGHQQQKNGGPLRLATGKVFRMRRGVGIELARDHDEAGAGARAARRLHAELQRRWWGFLSEQDRQPWRPHWTVQNKAADETAVDAAMEDVRTSFRGAEGLATGCTLWRYERSGRWTFERGFDFSGDK